MALRQLQARQSTAIPVATFKKTTTATGLNRHALGNVSNKQLPTNTHGHKGKPLRVQQSTRPVVKNGVIVTHSKNKPTIAAGLGENAHTMTNACTSSTTSTTLNHIATQPEAIEDMVSVVCESMSPKSHPSHKRCITPQPMDVSEVAGALQRKLQLEETDKDKERTNPQFCSEYVQDVYQYLRELEARYHPNPKYMSLQPQINYRMRAILIDWLVLVQVKFNLLPETLYLTVSIIDRFLEVFPVTKDKLQLVGVTAMLIASKYEEIYFPQVQDFVYITDHSYSEEEVRAMERVILKTIGYNLGIPAAIHFLRRYSKLNQVNSRTHTMAKFFLELSLVSYSMLAYLPSQVAASALYLARKILTNEREQWDEENISEYYGEYTVQDLGPCCSQLAVILKGMHSSKQQAVREKYTNSKFLSVAKDPALRGGIIQELSAQKKAV